MGSNAPVFLPTSDCGVSHAGPAMAVAYPKMDRTVQSPSEDDLWPMVTAYGDALRRRVIPMRYRIGGVGQVRTELKCGPRF